MKELNEGPHRKFHFETLLENGEEYQKLLSI